MKIEELKPEINNKDRITKSKQHLAQQDFFIKVTKIMILSKDVSHR